MTARLRARFGERVQSKVSCPRPEAMSLLRRSLFSLSPADRLGWGLIGDSWGSGTPVISAAEHYDLQADQNCLIARTPEEFVNAVIALQTESSVWNRIVEGGHTSVGFHSVERVSEILLQCLQEAAAKG